MEPVALPPYDDVNKQTGAGRSVEQRSGLDIGGRNLLTLTGEGVATLAKMSTIETPFAKAGDMSNGAMPRLMVAL